MATFGSIASPAPNVLYDAAKVDRDVQSFQRNRLLMDNARQDQQYQTFDRDRQEVARASASLLSLPPEQRPAAYAAAVQQLQAQGFARRAPPQYPGDEQIEALARQGMTPEQQFSLTEKRRASEALMGALGLGGGAAPMGATPVSMSVPAGGAMPPTVAPAPIGGGDVRAQNADAAAQRADAMSRLSGPELEAELARISGGRAQAANGVAPGTPFRPAAGVDGVYAGLPAPTGAVPNLADAAGGLAPVVQASAPAGPALPQVGSNGLTREQTALVAAAAQTNPAGAVAMISQLRQQNQMAADRAGDNQRAERQFTAQQAQIQEQNRRADEAARRQTETSPWMPDPERPGAVIPRPGGPEDPEVRQRNSRMRRNGAPIPAHIQKADNDEIEGIQIAGNISADVAALRGEIEGGKIPLGWWSNQLATARNAVGASTEETRRFATLQATIERIRNDSLRLNKGVQTEGDAVRAGNELVANLNDPKNVAEQLARLEQINRRAVAERIARVQSRRRENDLPELNVDQFQGQEAAVAQRPGRPTTQEAPRPSSPVDAIAAARRKLGAGAADDDVVEEAYRMMGGGRGQ